MKNLLFLVISLFLFIPFSLQGQRNCGTMDYLQEQEIKFPGHLQRLSEIETYTQKRIKAIKNGEEKIDGIITIPVVVHIVYNNANENLSEAQILTQLDVLNEDFRLMNADADGTWPQAEDSEIEFCLATTDPTGNATNGITRTSTSTTSFSTNNAVKFTSSGGRDAWPASDYLNIWVCDLTSFLGYAQFPGGNSATDGVVCDFAYFGTIGTATTPYHLGRTATHEVGHWLNLRHIWGDGGCTVDDFVADTPLSDAPNYNCLVGHVSCGTTDMVQNYMDYSDDDCMNLFTSGQKARMRALFDPGGARVSLLSSAACGLVQPPTCNDGIQNQGELGVDCGGPCPNSCPIVYCTSGGTNTNFEYIQNVSFGSINNSSGNNGGYADFTSLSTAIVAGTSATIMLTPGFTQGSYNEFWRVWVDFNQDADFADAGEQVFSGNGTAAVSGMISIPTGAMSGSTRMRISMRWNQLPDSPCGSYQYGEVEDYTLIISGGCTMSASGAEDTPVSCNGGSDGSATVTSTGGIAPLSYLWDNGETSSTATALAAGIHTVTVSDFAVCTAIAELTVSEPPLLVASTAITHVSCFGGSDGAIDLTASGGVPPYAYTWANGLGNPEDISGLVPGTYSVTVTDANLCETTASAVINQPEILLATAFLEQAPLCHGDANAQVIVFTNGGLSPYTFLWDNGETTATATMLDAGVHSVTVSDANACLVIENIIIPEPQPLTLASMITNESLMGQGDGSIDLMIAGGTPGFIYEWSSGQTTQDISGLNAGSYSLTLTDTNQCMVADTFTVYAGVSFCPTALLQGSFNSAASIPSEFMRTSLNTLELIPLQQPYNQVPWNYAGTEGFNDLSELPADMVDWVFVVIRDGANAATTLERYAGVLHSDGSITSTTGIPVTLNIFSASGYFIEINHRGHLPVVSADVLFPDGSGQVCFDFSTDLAMTYANPAIINSPVTTLFSVAGTYYGLTAGNVQSADCQVDINDLNAIFFTYGLSNFYGNADVNMDGQVDINDINLLFGSFNRSCHRPF